MGRANRKQNGIAVGLWNARALVHSSATRRDTKRSVLRNLVARTQATAVLETHGSAEDVELMLGTEGAAVKIYATNLPERCTGGVAIILRKAWVENAEITPTVWAEGRALEVKVTMANKSVHIVAVHNFEVDKTAAQQLCDRIESLRQQALHDPRGSSTFVVGDWNYQAAGERPTPVNRQPAGE